MLDLLTYLKNINPDVSHLSISEIKCEKDVHGFQCNVNTTEKSILAGGSSKDKETAIRIAIAEAFERSLVKSIINNEVLSSQFLLDHFPSSSGFAAGFNDYQTKFRSICEGFERWAWSKWIDDGFNIPLVNPDKDKISSLGKFLLKSFNETYWFGKEFELTIPDSGSIKLYLIIFLGCNNNGIFPGSRVTSLRDDLFEHPVIEAHRNFINYEMNSSELIDHRDIIQKRIIFFGKNKALAFKQIDEANKENWPTPEIRLLKNFPTEHPQLFLYRCLMKDFIGWHEGDVTRFVY